MKLKFRSRSVLFLIVLLQILAISAFADQVDDYVRSQIIERHVPGVAVAVIKGGKIVKMKGYGLASVEFNVPATSKTVFEIGSVSKQMTAAGIMLLVEDGKLQIDEKISKYLPNTPEAWKDVTIRHLLTHTSGIKSYSSLDGFELSRRLKIDDFIKLLSPYPLEFTPGEKNIYSNSGFNLLADIIETQSGKPYLEFMRERIFGPLGMTETTDRDPQFIVLNRAAGYEWENGHLAGRDASLTDLTGAGSIVSTIADMTKWDAALSGNKFLKPESKRAIWTQFTFNNGTLSPYGFGWRISEIRGHKLIGHTGQTAGFGAANFRYADDDTIVIVLTNLGELGLGGQIAARIAKYYIPAISLKAMPARPERVAGIGDKLRSLLISRSADKLDTTLITQDLARILSTERSKTTYRRIATLGTPEDVTFVGSVQSGAREAYQYRVRAGKDLFLWRVAIDTDGKMSDLDLDEEE